MTRPKLICGRCLEPKYVETRLPFTATHDIAVLACGHEQRARVK